MRAAARRGVRHTVLTAVAISLSATALIAIGILLFGRFGETEGRILGTTLLLAAYGLVALPAGFLFDQSRHFPLATAVLALTITGLALALVSIWGADSATVGKSILSVTSFAVAASQTGALAARRRKSDPGAVRTIFVLSCGLALTLATMATVAAWVELDSQAYLRAFGALAVLDALLVALQPVLALARLRSEVYRLRLSLDRGEEIDIEVEAGDFAAAAARAIRNAERSGLSVRRVAHLNRGG